MSKPSKQLKLVVKNGQIKTIYDDALTALFPGARWVRTKRASHVEPHGTTANGGMKWASDLTPVGGPVLMNFKTRQQALDAERDYLNRHVIT